MQEQRMQEQSTAEQPLSSVGVDAQPSSLNSAEEATMLPRDVNDAIVDMAQQISEEPTRLRKRQDVTQVLEKMTDGVIVVLHISRPRFSASIAPKRGGMAFGLEKLGITNSEAARKVIREYFSLGRHSLLPTELQRELASIENTARACLDRFALKTHWGYFVPTSNYAAWKSENERHQQKFLDKKQYVLDHYDEIIEQVMAAYRTLAEEAWMQTAFGSMVVKENKERLSEALFTELYQYLEAGQGKEAFVDKYLSYIRGGMPTHEEVAGAFEYEFELGYIPLPSLLAKDIDEADYVVRTRALQDAKLRAEMDAIEAQRRAELDAIQERQRIEEAQRRAEWQKLNEQQRLEREAAYMRLQVEQEKLRAEREKVEHQRTMDRDVLNQAKKQKEQLVQEFYIGVAAQINQLIKEVCEETLASLDEHVGVLRGPVSARLGKVVKRLKNLNFIEDEQIAEQIRQLEDVLPTKAQRDEAKRGIARIDTSGIRRVVQQINKEAGAMLLELGLNPIQRTHRQTEEMNEDTLLLDEPRKARPSTEFGKPGASLGRRQRAKGTVNL